MNADLRDSQLAAKDIVEEDERFRRESAAYQARVKEYEAWLRDNEGEISSDLLHDYEHDIGESPRDWRTRL